MTLKTFISFLFLTSSLFSQTPTLTYSSQTADGYPLAVSGNSPASITVTSSVSVNWSCAGVGTCSFTNPSTTMTFTPPAHVINKHQIGGCPIGPNDSIYNTDISSAPANSNSSTWVGHSTTVPLSFGGDLARLITFVNNSTPTRTFKAYYGSPAPSLVLPWPPAEGSSSARQREGGSDVGSNYTNGTYVTVPGSNAFTDHHVLEVNTTDCSINEVYDDVQSGAPNQTSTNAYWGTVSPPTVNCQDGSSSGCNTTSMAHYSGLQYSIGNTNTTLGTGASGASELASFITLAELKSGSINHVARMAENNGYYTTNFLWPVPQGNGGCAPSTCPNNPPMGAWFRLNSSFNASSVCNSGNSVEDVYCTTLVNQQKHYGFFIADGTSGSILGSAADWTSDPLAVAAAKEFSVAVNATNYTVIDVSGAVSATGTGSAQVKPTGTVTPSQYAAITATPPVSGAAVTVPVFLQGVGIGMTSQQLNVVSGTFIQMSWWVEPATLPQTVNWTLTSGVGSVTNGGVYTAPTLSANAALGSAVLTGTSTYDSSSTITVYVTVIPTSADGSIRLSGFGIGNVTDATSAANVWYNCCMLSGASAALGTTYFPILTSVNQEAAVYNSDYVTYGNDIRIDLALPNGNYKVRLMYAQTANNQTQQFNNCQCGNMPIDTNSGGLGATGLSPVNIDINGQIVAHWFDPFYANNCYYVWACPSDKIVNTTVSNNTLYIAQRAVASDLPGFLGAGQSKKFNSINGIQIIPDSTAASLAIDKGSNVVNKMLVSPGSSTQPFWATQNYFTGGTTTWAVSGGPCGVLLSCSLSNDGGEVLTLGSPASGVVVPAGQPIVVTATNGSNVAKVTFYTSGSGYVSF